MAGSNSNQDIFDVRKIRRLVELMKEHDLSELDLRQGETRIQLRRSAEPAVTASHAAPAPPVAPATKAETKPAEPPEAGASEEAAPAGNVIEITSPMVGTFFTAPDPDSPPFVKVGDHVGPETTVCIVEAMKLFNQIPAGVSGKIVAVLVDGGEPVEFGQPMFRVEVSE